MKINYFFKHILTPLTLIISLWAILYLLKFSKQESVSEHLNIIPNNAKIVVQIKGNSLAKKTIFEMLFQSKNDSIVNVLKDKLSVEKYEETKLGISYLSNHYLFESNYKNEALWGLILPLNESDDFEKIIKNQTNKSLFAINQKKNGIILFSKKLTKTDLENFYKSKMNKGNDFKFEDNGQVFQTISKNNINSKINPFSRAISGIALNSKQIAIDGDFTIATNFQNDFHVILNQLENKPDFFHFSYGFFPDTILYSINNLIKNYELTFPKIHSISMNYNGIEMLESGSYILPNMELVLNFDDKFDIQTILSNESLIEKIEGKVVGNTLKINTKTYFFKQLTANSIYIGDIKNPSFKKETTSFVEINGNLSALLKINGGDMFLSFLNGIPAYKGLKDLFNSIENTSILLTKKGNNAKLKGAINFKKENYAMDELMQFILTIQPLLNM